MKNVAPELGLEPSSLNMCVCACVRACVRASVRACVRACVRVCECVRARERDCISVILPSILSRLWTC